MKSKFATAILGQSTEGLPLNYSGTQRLSGSEGASAPGCHTHQTSAEDAGGVAAEGWLRSGWFSGVHATCEDVSVLMVHGESDCLCTLGAVLSERLLARVTHARDCSEASRALEERTVPDLIVSATKLRDGSWEDILNLARMASQPVHVLVVSRVGNISLYAEVMSCGAFDFITPNIPPAAFVQVLRDAADDVCRRREAADRLRRVQTREPGSPETRLLNF
jgi:PleD family two-component response regulator